MAWNSTEGFQYSIMESATSVIQRQNTSNNVTELSRILDIARHREYQASRFMWSYLAPLILVVGTVGSVLSLFVLCRKSMRSQTTMFYLAVLAVADLMVLYAGMLRLWLEYAHNIFLRITSPAACRWHTFFVYFALDMSVWTLVSVSVDRCLYVSWPLWARKWCTLRHARIIIVVIICFSIAINLHFLWTYDVDPYDSQHIYANGGKKCYADVTSSLTIIFVETVWPWIDFCKFCLIPFIFMATSNVLIIRQLVRTERNMASYHSSGQEVGLQEYSDKTLGKRAGNSSTIISVVLNQTSNSTPETRRDNYTHKDVPDSRNGCWKLPAESYQTEAGRERKLFVEPESNDDTCATVKSSVSGRLTSNDSFNLSHNIRRSVNQEATHDNSYVLPDTQAQLSENFTNVRCETLSETIESYSQEDETGNNRQSSSPTSDSMCENSYLLHSKNSTVGKCKPEANIPDFRSHPAEAELKLVGEDADMKTSLNILTKIYHVNSDRSIMSTTEFKFKGEGGHISIMERRRTLINKIHPACDCLPADLPLEDLATTSTPEVSKSWRNDLAESRDDDDVRQCICKTGRKIVKENTHALFEKMSISDLTDEQFTRSHYLCEVCANNSTHRGKEENMVNGTVITECPSHEIGNKDGCMSVCNQTNTIPAKKISPELKAHWRSSSCSSDPHHPTSSRRTTSSVSKTLLVVTVMFWIFNAPVVIFVIGHTYFVSSANGRDRATIILAWTIVNLIQYMNNALHFFLYCLTSSKFRQELKDMFKCRVQPR